MRKIKGIHKAVEDPIDDLITYRAMPTHVVPMNALDPFIFLNHHGYQEYPENNNGLPFGPHPHRGFETVTFIIKGDLTHKDSAGAESIITEGGVQWMTAGSGLIHAEVSSEDFKRKGGPLEILQLWVNLPSKHKMTQPFYQGLQENQIPKLSLDNNRATLHAISGNWDGVEGPVHPLTDIRLSRIDFDKAARVSFSIPREKTVFFYVVRGKIHVNNRTTSMHHLVEFGHDDEEIIIEALEPSLLLFGDGTPFHESFIAYGPFVMNSKKEILEAYEDFNKGKMGDPSTLGE